LEVHAVTGRAEKFQASYQLKHTNCRKKVKVDACLNFFDAKKLFRQNESISTKTKSQENVIIVYKYIYIHISTAT
jgi:hypothetical protein